jgi:hypothetical protein
MRQGFQIRCLLPRFEEKGFFAGSAEDQMDLEAGFRSGAI